MHLLKKTKAQVREKTSLLNCPTEISLILVASVLIGESTFSNNNPAVVGHRVAFELQAGLLARDSFGRVCKKMKMSALQFVKLGNLKHLTWSDSSRLI